MSDRTKFCPFCGMSAVPGYAGLHSCPDLRAYVKAAPRLPREAAEWPGTEMCGAHKDECCPVPDSCICDRTTDMMHVAPTRPEDDDGRCDCGDTEWLPISDETEDYQSCDCPECLVAAVGTETFEEAFIDIFDEALDILIERQRKYGPDNIAGQGLYGVTQRIVNDKIARVMRALNGRVTNGRVVLDQIDLGEPELCSECGHPTRSGDDTLTDAYIDIANYALICVALLRGKWGKPLEEEL